jgi:hypothetical protein
MGKVNTEINQLGKPNFFPNQTWSNILLNLDLKNNGEF